MRFIKYCLLALVIAFPAAAQENLHLGSLSWAITSGDGENGDLDFDVDATALTGEYFVSEKVSLGITFEYYEEQYDFYADNDLCETDSLQLGVAYHARRANILAGTGKGYSVGIRSDDRSTDCRDDNGFASSDDETTEYIDFKYDRGLGNGLTFRAYLLTDIDDFLDDREIGLGLTKIFGDQIGISALYAISESTEYSFDVDSSVFEVSASFYF
jgi:hypothetical protein